MLCWQEPWKWAVTRMVLWRQVPQSGWPLEHQVAAATSGRFVAAWAGSPALARQRLPEARVRRLVDLEQGASKGALGCWRQVKHGSGKSISTVQTAWTGALCSSRSNMEVIKQMFMQMQQQSASRCRT